MESLTLLCFLFVAAKSTTCNTPIDLNTATSSQLTTLPYITPDTAQLIIDARPICSPLDLTGRRKIKGITKNRLNKNWNWFKNQKCSDTCCLAKAHCESQGQDSSIFDPETTYHFEANDWSECTAKCGTGTQKRNVQCLDSNDNIVDDINCVTLDKKLATKRICNNNPCPTYNWVTDKYGNCVADSHKAVCMQTRLIKCYDTANDKPVNDLKCDIQNNKPDDTRECNDCPLLRSRRQLLDAQTTVNLLNEYNSDACNTDMYRNVNDKTLITRRACKTNILITSRFNLDVSLFNLDVTLQADRNEKVDINYSYSPVDEYSGYIIIDIPNNGYIGEFKYKLYLRNKQIAYFTLFVLFNPYSTESEVYIKSLTDRNEYVENEFGLIWTGSANYNSAVTWTYDHLDFTNLKISMNALKRLSLKYRNNIVIISRQITYAIGKDLCYGKWYGNYYDTQYSQSPWSWTGTGELFDIYRKTYRPVRYCQCWVFAGMLTTIGRALGIPTRTVSNFLSAHDTDFNRAIESYWILNDGIYTHVNGETYDSVWNFHAWNEMYFKRNDFIDNEYNIAGWQAVDSTPQEQSYGGNPSLGYYEGAYQMGPAAISLIRNNKNPHECKSETVYGKERFGCFDTEFVISETNANYNYWIKNKYDSKYTLYSIWHAYGGIGALTNTKKPGVSSLSDCLNEAIGDCSNEYIDLTYAYKMNEPSYPGQATDTSNVYNIGDTKRRLYSKDIEGIEYDIHIIPNKKDMIVTDNSEDIINKYGGDYTYGMIGININSFENDILNIYCRLSVAAYDYSGKQIGDEIKDKVMKNVKLNIGQSVNECEMYLYYNDYKKWVSDDVSEVPYIFKFTATVGAFKDGDKDEAYDIIIEQRDVLVCDPDIKLNDRIICKRNLKWFQPMKSGIEGDGFCDDAFNNNENNYDNGDCCKETCVANKLYNCPYFNCIDPKVNNKNKDFKKCPKIKSFVKHVKELFESGICTQVWRNVIENNLKCPKNGLLFENANQCMDKILIMKNKFGNFKSCYKEAFNALDIVKIKPIIKIVADCIDNYKTLKNKCYNTLDKNPCKNEENIKKNNLLYFKSCTSCCNFIQCDANNIGYAYDMPCGIGKYWDNNKGQCKRNNNGKCNENCGQKKY